MLIAVLLAVAWLIVGIASGVWLRSGAAMLQLLALGFGFVVMESAHSGTIERLTQTEMRTLVILIAVLAVIGFSVIVLSVTHAPGAAEALGLGTAVGAALYVYASVCLTTHASAA